MQPKPRFSYSLLAVGLLLVLMLQARFWAARWETHNVLAVLSWDVMGYYLYLPAHFIYHDLLHLGFAADIMREYRPSGSFYQAFPVDGRAGDFVMKYTCGQAVLWIPFFFLGHWAAGWAGYAQDGFSAPYQLAIALGSMCYAVLGLLVLRRVLLRYFTEAVTASVLVLLVLGTNYFQYAVFDAPMPHSLLFSLYALLLWLTIRWHEAPNRLRAAGIGLVLGLLVLIRPSEMVAVVIPVLWGLTSARAVRAKLDLLRTRWLDVVVLAACGLLGAAPQVLYWKWATGHFLFNSYGTGPQFSFLKPHVWNVLFSFRKGWLLYTPLLLLPLVGWVVLWRRYRAVAVPTLAFFVLNLWVVTAWDTWGYGGSIGQRSMVQSYAVLALPWGALLTWLWEPARRAATQVALVSLTVLLVDLNLFQHWQYMTGDIHPEEMTRRYYFAIFNNPQPTQADYVLLDVKTRLPGKETDYDRRLVGKLDFEHDPQLPPSELNGGFGYLSPHAYQAQTGRQFSPALAVRPGAAGLQPGQWVRASCQVFSDYGAWDNTFVVSIERTGMRESLLWQSVHLQNNHCINKRWNDIFVDLPLPADLRADDLIKVYGMNNNGSACLLDDIQLEVFIPKQLPRW